MQAKATVKNLRISPKKARLVANLIKGMDARAAQDQLNFLNKRSALAILKLLNSAISNGENNFGLQRSNLFIKEIRVDGGITIKRWSQRAFGRAAMIRKKASHVKLVLDEKIPTQLSKIKKIKENTAENVKFNTQSENIIKGENGSGVSQVTDKEKKFFNRESGGHGMSKGFKKKIFQRKAG